MRSQGAGEGGQVVNHFRGCQDQVLPCPVCLPAPLVGCVSSVPLPGLPKCGKAGGTQGKSLDL